MRVLVAEDEQDLADVLVAMLEHSGYVVDAAVNGKEAVELAQKNTYDAMVLDIMMPVMDGITALQTIRDMGIVTPALFLTAKAEVDDRITGLDAGADDYLTKPFALGELLARLRALTRRNSVYRPRTLELGDLTLDTENAQMSCVNSISLELHEVKLMEYLIQNNGRMVAEEDIYLRVWGEQPEEEQSVVWMYISYLRGKLRAIGTSVQLNGKRGEFYVLETGHEE